MTSRSVIVLLCLSVVCVCVSASDKLNQCYEVASAFNNTCTTAPSGAAPSVTAMKGVTRSCDNVGQCCGTQSGPTCTWERKLCVSCRQAADGEVYIRAQTNDLPSTCYSSPKVALKEQDVDFEVKFDVDVQVGSDGVPIPRTDMTWPSTQTGVDDLLCGKPNAVTPDSDVPAANNLTIYSGSQPLNVGVGVALTGVLILNDLSADGVDPFWPSGGLQAEKVDMCLAHPQAAAIFHYHFAPPCLFSDFPYAEAPAGCDAPNFSATCWDRLKDYALSGYPKRLTVSGLAKDGRVIYGPYDDSGELVTGVDVCGGRLVDGRYGYHTQFYFPSLVGCFGPGNFPDDVPSCTTNPPTGYSPPSTPSSSSS